MVLALSLRVCGEVRILADLRVLAHTIAALGVVFIDSALEIEFTFSDWVWISHRELTFRERIDGVCKGQ